MKKDICKKICIRRLQILVHSYIYYELNESAVPDAVWGEWAQELVSLQRDYPDESKGTPLYQVFKDFDGSTGFDLPYNNSYTRELALGVLSHECRYRFLEAEG